MTHDPRINSDPDFVALPRYQNSVDRVCQQFPDGVVPAELAADGLNMSVEEYEGRMADAVRSIQRQVNPQPL